MSNKIADRMALKLSCVSLLALSTVLCGCGESSPPESPRPAGTNDGDGDVGAALTDLKSDSPELRAQAIRNLTARAIAANRLLWELGWLLDDENEQVRNAAKRLWVRVKVAKALSEMTHKDKGWRASGAFDLGHIVRMESRFDPPVNEMIPALVAGLRDPDAFVRGRAAEALGKFETRAADAVPALVRCLADGGAWVRSSAAVSLGQIKAGEAVAALMTTLKNDAEPEVRACAAWALGIIGPPDATVALPLLKKASNENHKKVREEAMEAIARITWVDRRTRTKPATGANR